MVVTLDTCYTMTHGAAWRVVVTSRYYCWHSIILKRRADVNSFAVVGHHRIINHFTEVGSFHGLRSRVTHATVTESGRWGWLSGYCWGLFNVGTVYRFVISKLTALFWIQMMRYLIEQLINTLEVIRRSCERVGIVAMIGLQVAWHLLADAWIERGGN